MLSCSRKLIPIVSLTLLVLLTELACQTATPEPLTEVEGKLVHGSYRGDPDRNANQSFNIESKGNILEVLYYGTLPDSFRDRRATIAIYGTFDGQKFNADVVIASVSNRPLTHVSAGNGHTCVIETGGSAACWGSGNDGSQWSPPEGVLFKDISAGAAYTCGLALDGTPICWGNATWGTHEDAQLLPQTGERLETIEAGQIDVCGLRADGTPVCWGQSGQYPTGSEKFKAISVGYGVCGLRNDGTVAC